MQHIVFEAWLRNTQDVCVCISQIRIMCGNTLMSLHYSRDTRCHTLFSTSISLLSHMETKLRNKGLDTLTHLGIITMFGGGGSY